MKYKITTLLLTLIFTSVFFSCYRTLDFDQAELTAKPVVDADIAYFTLQASHLIDPATNLERTVASDTTRVEIFDNDNVRNQLTHIDFHIKMKNEFKRKFTVTVRFLDENYSATHTINLNIDEATMVGANVSPVNLDYNEQLSVPSSVTAFKQTRFAIIDVTLLPDVSGTNPIVLGDSATFNFQSAGTFYFDLGI